MLIERQVDVHAVERCNDGRHVNNDRERGKSFHHAIQVEPRFVRLTAEARDSIFRVLNFETLLNSEL